MGVVQQCPDNVLDVFDLGLGERRGGVVGCQLHLGAILDWHVWVRGVLGLGWLRMLVLVISHECKGDRSPFVPPKSWGDGTWVVSVLIELLGEKFVG